ncbi:hypothetical protein GCM10010392_65240 [Streptomyces clavifer]|nr:hypothetical protein GCM10010392_65240 [Streptomyces clavifer]
MAGNPMMKFTHTGTSCLHHDGPSDLNVTLLPNAANPMSPMAAGYLSGQSGSSDQTTSRTD